MARLQSARPPERSGASGGKFHTSEELIKQLNPDKTVDRAGTVITVPNVATVGPTASFQD